MKKSLLLLSFSAFFMQCRSTKIIDKASIKEQNCITCFDAKLEKATCETSAIVFDGEKILIANDKDMPDGRTSVFVIKDKIISADTSKVAYLKSPVFKSAKKYEDFAITPNQQLVFLSTGFDRVKENSTDFDAYNSILYWERGKEESPKILSSEPNATTSVALRKQIAQVLANEKFPNGMPYYKIEGFAATNENLYLGVREIGESFKTPQYVAKIIEVPYKFENGLVTLTGAMKVICDFNTNAQPAVKANLGLSSLEYDRFNKKFIMLTSYENGDKLGAYIWTASLKELKNSEFHLVKTTDNQPLFIETKAEDVAVVDKKTLFLINDDDRVKTSVGKQTRQLNQAFYQIIELF